MEINNNWTAIREDRALPAAHTGTSLRTLGTTVCTKQRSLVAPMGSFAVATAYVAGQESNPPREESG